MSKTIPGGIFSTGLIDNVFNDNKEAISQAILDRYVDFMCPDGGIVINNVAETGLQVIDQGGGKLAIKSGVAYDKWGQRIYIATDDAGSAVITGNDLTGGIDLSTNKNIKLNVDEAGVVEIDCSSEAATTSSTQVYEIVEAINKAGFGTIAFRSDGAGNPDNSGQYISTKSSTVGQNSKIVFTAPSANDATSEIYGLDESAYPHNYVGTTVGHNVPANSEAYNVIIEYLAVRHAVGNFLAGYPVGDDTAYTQIKDSYKITITQDSPVNNENQHELLLAQVMYDGDSMDITDKRGDSVMGVKWVANPGTLSADAFIDNSITGAKLADSCLENRHFATDIISADHIQHFVHDLTKTNIVIGVNALGGDLTQMCLNNIVIGKEAMQYTSACLNSIAIGSESQRTANAAQNISLGYASLGTLSTGSNNVAIGIRSGYLIETGKQNISIGFRSLYGCRYGDNNIALGHQALFENVNGVNNIALGYESLKSVDGDHNISLGYQALKNYTGDNCIALGYQALYTNTAIWNIAIGLDAMKYTANGNNNVAMGSQAFRDNVSGAQNVVIGSFGLYSQSEGNTGLTALGYHTDISDVTGISNATALGKQAEIDESNSVILGNASVINIKSGSDGSCDLGKSDKRFKDIYATNSVIQTSDINRKKDIQPSGLGLEFINQLTPVSFQWKDVDKVSELRDVPESDEKEDFVIQPELKHHRKHYGLIAQSVKEVLDAQGIDTENFAGYIHDEDTDTFGLRYIEFIAPMIKAIQELSEKIKQLETK